MTTFTGLFWEEVHELGQNSGFRDGSLITGAPRRATVVATMACERVEVPKSAFEMVCGIPPNLAEGLIGMME